jgi:hypothetical protein
LAVQRVSAAPREATIPGFSLRFLSALGQLLFKRDLFQEDHAFCVSMIFSDLPSPAEALNERTKEWTGLRAGGKPVPTFRDHAVEIRLADQAAVPLAAASSA